MKILSFLILKYYISNIYKTKDRDFVHLYLFTLHLQDLTQLLSTNFHQIHEHLWQFILIILDKHVIIKIQIWKLIHSSS